MTWTQVVPFGSGHFPEPETLPPDGATVEYLRRHHTGGFPPNNIFTHRMRGEVRRVKIYGCESADILHPHVLADDETFDDETAEFGDWWRLVE